MTQAVVREMPKAEVMGVVMVVILLTTILMHLSYIRFVIKQDTMPSHHHRNTYSYQPVDLHTEKAAMNMSSPPYEPTWFPNTDATPLSQIAKKIVVPIRSP